MVPDPQVFTRDWIDAWNAHDIEAILSHYADDFRMSSPYIALLEGVPSGMLKGKRAVRAYWKKALERIPDLHFKALQTFQGAGSLAIHYEGALGRTVVEVFFFSETGKVRQACAMYS